MNNLSRMYEILSTFVIFVRRSCRKHLNLRQNAIIVTNQILLKTQYCTEYKTVAHSDRRF